MLNIYIHYLLLSGAEILSQTTKNFSLSSNHMSKRKLLATKQFPKYPVPLQGNMVLMVKVEGYGSWKYIHRFW